MSYDLFVIYSLVKRSECYYHILDVLVVYLYNIIRIVVNLEVLLDLSDLISDVSRQKEFIMNMIIDLGRCVSHNKSLSVFKIKEEAMLEFLSECLLIILQCSWNSMQMWVSFSYQNLWVYVVPVQSPKFVGKIIW